MNEFAHLPERAVRCTQVRGEIDGSTTKTPCARCTRDASRVRTSPSVCLLFAFRPLTWQKREDTIFSFSRRYSLHAPLCVPALAISRRRFRGRISPVLVTASGEKEDDQTKKKRERETRIRRAFRFSTAFDVTEKYVGKRLLVATRFFIGRAKKSPFSPFSSLSSSISWKFNVDQSDQRTISGGFYCACLKSQFRGFNAWRFKERRISDLRSSLFQILCISLHNRLMAWIKIEIIRDIVISIRYGKNF